MELVHRILGFAMPTAFFGLAVWGMILRIAKREEEPVAYRAVLHWTENLLVLQIVVGIVLLIIGKRILVPGESLDWLHYFYGSLFPLIAVIGGRIASLRRERYPYVGIAWGAFFAFGLTTRALMLGLASVFD